MLFNHHNVATQTSYKSCGWFAPDQTGRNLTLISIWVGISNLDLGLIVLWCLHCNKQDVSKTRNSWLLGLVV